VRISAATEAGSPDVPNEDWYGVTPSVIVVLDGVTSRGSVTGSCSHGTPWYVRQLGACLLGAAERKPWPLATALRWAIGAVAEMHRECDLAAIDAPSAAVGVLRFSERYAEYLVLADVTVLLETATGIQSVTDNRVEASVADVPVMAPDVGEQIAARRKADRNREGGYWVAAGDPEAADHAVAGLVSLTGLRRAAVMTDGAARAADLFGAPWDGVLSLSPSELISTVRVAEHSDPDCVKRPRFKLSDDATAVFWEAG
jgi:hypothetical protein